MPARVAGVLLAAGDGSRLGQPKAVVQLGGRSLAARGADLLRAGGADLVIVVTGAVPVDLAGVQVVQNPRWRDGMGSSFAAGLTAIPADCAAAVIALADQPLVGAEAVRRLIAAFTEGAAVKSNVSSAFGVGSFAAFSRRAAARRSRSSSSSSHRWSRKPR